MRHDEDSLEHDDSAAYPAHAPECRFHHEDRWANSEDVVVAPVEK